MFLDLIQKRRSIRKFQQRPVEGLLIDKLIEAALRAPTSRDRKPWELVVVNEPARLEALSRSKTHGSSFLHGAPLGIVVCADTTKSDVWVEDCSIATTFILLTAEALGLGSCWIQIRGRPHGDGTSARDYIAGLLGLPAHIDVESIVGLGYPAETKPPHTAEELTFDKVHSGGFGIPYYPDATSGSSGKGCP